METTCQEDDTLHVTVFEIEPGLFHATYRTDGSFFANPVLPPYHVGSGVSDAKKRIEACARSQGFGTIVWDVPGLYLEAPPNALHAI